MDVVIKTIYLPVSLVTLYYKNRLLVIAVCHLLRIYYLRFILRGLRLCPVIFSLPYIQALLRRRLKHNLLYQKARSY